MMSRQATGIYSPVNYPTDSSYIAHPSSYGKGIGTRHVILCCHGHGGYSYQYSPATLAMPGVHTPPLVDGSGYALMGVDHSQINAWGDANAMRALDDAYNWLLNTFLMPTPKVAIQGWSMGGLTALNWIRRNPGKVAGAWIWNPATDVKFWETAPAGYTPSYALGGVAQASYTAEIDSVFAPSTTASAAYTIPASGGAGINMNVANAKGFADAYTLGGVALPRATVNGVAFTYTGKTDTALLGCVSTTGSTIAVANAAAITGVFATQYPAYSPWENAASFSVANGFTFPIKISQASDDTTVPPAQNTDPVNGFVARTGNPNITLRTPIPTGGHSTSISNVPSTEVQAFYDSLTW